MAARAGLVAGAALAALWMTAGATGPGEARAALPGRVDVVDLVRLRAYGVGRIEAASPALDAAAGPEGAFGFGPVGCEAGGFGYRPIVHPQASLVVDVPAGSQRLDVVLRPAHGLRDLQVTLDGDRVAVEPLEAGWQRVTVALPEGTVGRHRLGLTLTRAGKAVEEGPAMPQSWRGLLHAVILSANAAGPGGAVAAPVAEHDALWLEPGEQVLLPLTQHVRHALETRGMRTRGDVSGLTLVVERIWTFGGRHEVARLPAALVMPWNLALGDPRTHAPVYLRVSLEGTSDGAVGLVAPRLTAPGDAPAVAAAPPVGRPIVVVALRGVRADAVGEALADVPGAARLNDVWSTATTFEPALASLLTGRHPQALGLLGTSDALPKGTRTLAQHMADAGRHTILRTSRLPLTASSPLWAGFADAVVGAPPGAREPFAPDVLRSVVTAILRAPDERPVFALAVVGDGGPPWMPRTDAWQQHGPPEGRQPWKPLQTREVLIDVAGGKRRLTERDHLWLDTLRRATAAETLGAVRQFIAQVQSIEQFAPIVVVVGLGGEPADPAADALTPANLHVPAWIIGTPVEAAARRATHDLTDLAASLMTWGGASADLTSGRPVDRATVAWPATTLATHRGEAELVVQGDAALRVPRRGGAPQLLLRREGRWSPAPEVAESDPTNQRVLADLLGRQRDAFLAAGAAWHEPAFGPPATLQDRSGHGHLCTR